MSASIQLKYVNHKSSENIQELAEIRGELRNLTKHVVGQTAFLQSIDRHMVELISVMRDIKS